MNKALPLHEYIYEETLPAKRRMDIIFNLAELYSQEFSMELVENCFDFPETVVGDGWENWDVEGDSYSIGGYVHPLPKTLGDFIHNCAQDKYDLVWDGNLIKRNFKLIL